MIERVELKFLVERTKTLRLLQALAEKNILLQDPFTDKDTGWYTIESLYFDTPDHNCFMDSIEGYPIRNKIRIRHYRDASYHICSTDMLELKTKNLQHVCKIRSPYPTIPNNLISCFKFNNLSVPGPWVQVVVIEYERYAFMLSLDDTLRITLDIDVRSKVPNDFSGPHRGVVFLNPRYAILEIKGSNQESIRTFYTFLCKYLSVQPTRFSKYCLGVLSIIPSYSEEYWTSYYSYLSGDVFFDIDKENIFWTDR